MRSEFHSKRAPATIVRRASCRSALALAARLSPRCCERGDGMRGFLIGIAALALAGSASAQQQPAAPAAAATPAQAPVAPISPQIQRTLDQLRDAGLHDDHGYEIVRDLV